MKGMKMKAVHRMLIWLGNGAVVSAGLQALQGVRWINQIDCVTWAIAGVILMGIGFLAVGQE